MHEEIRTAAVNRRRFHPQKVLTGAGKGKCRPLGQRREESGGPCICTCKPPGKDLPGIDVREVQRILPFHPGDHLRKAFAVQDGHAAVQMTEGGPDKGLGGRKDEHGRHMAANHAGRIRRGEEGTDVRGRILRGGNQHQGDKVTAVMQGNGHGGTVQRTETAFFPQDGNPVDKAVEPALAGARDHFPEYLRTVLQQVQAIFHILKSQ